jgi:hypothetical protein
MASEALWGTALVWRSEGCSCELFEPKYALRPPVSMRVTSRRSSGLLTIAKNRGGAAEPVAGGQPVSIVQNISGDLLDGGAELHHLIGDADDRAGSLDDDEQRAGGALGGATRAKPPTPRAFGGCVWTDIHTSWTALLRLVFSLQRLGMPQWCSMKTWAAVATTSDQVCGDFDFRRRAQRGGPQCTTTSHRFSDFTPLYLFSISPFFILIEDLKRKHGEI